MPESPPHAKSEPSWSPLAPLILAGRQVVDGVKKRLEDLLRDSDEALRILGGDPSRTNWNAFRPLRPSREENWSDWLAWLLQESQTGALASRLMGGRRGLSDAPNFFISPNVEREVRVSGGLRRADLLVTWTDGEFTHIEVKIDDGNRLKTFDTARRLQSELSVNTHFLLLREEHIEAWENENESDTIEKSVPSVDVFTWRDIAKAVRRAIQEPNEGMRWRVFAHAFLGAVEQQILGHPRIAGGFLTSASVVHLGGLTSVVELLEEVAANE